MGEVKLDKFDAYHGAVRIMENKEKSRGGGAKEVRGCVTF